MLVVPVADVLMVAVYPSHPDDGAGCGAMVITGLAVTTKSVADAAALPPTETPINPVVAPAGTVAVMVVDVLAVTTAVTPLNVTVFAEGVGLKFVPVITTVVPTGPDVDTNDVIVGKFD